MKNNIIKQFAGYTGIILVFVFIFFGCRGKTPPVFFYTLAPVPESVPVPDIPKEKKISLGVGPLRLPDFLNKPQIATRIGASKINYSDFHRWGGYLDKDILRVISENLSRHLATEMVKTYPWSDAFHPEYQVALDVKQFDGELPGDVTLNVVWQLVDNSRKDRPEVVRRAVLREPVNSSSEDDYEALVAAQSRLLARLSARIAEAILNF